MLFNKYKNKDFITLTNYINDYIYHYTLDTYIPLTKLQITNTLSGDTNKIFQEALTAITSASTNKSAAIFQIENNYITPVNKSNCIQIRLTFFEKCWLQYILNDQKSSLFIDEETKNILLESLSELDNPIQNNYIDIKKATITQNFDPLCFKIIIQAILEKKSIILTNKTFSNICYNDSTVIPYKIEYDPIYDSFSLSAYSQNDQRPIKINLANIQKIKLGSIIIDYDELIKKNKFILDAKKNEPVILKISDLKNGYDRAMYILSNYDTICYEDEDKNLIMSLSYYDFQKDQLLSELLFLGSCIKVIGPKSFLLDYIEIIKKAYSNYIE